MRETDGLPKGAGASREAGKGLVLRVRGRYSESPGPRFQAGGPVGGVWDSRVQGAGGAGGGRKGPGSRPELGAGRAVPANSRPVWSRSPGEARAGGSLRRAAAGPPLPAP